MRKRRAFYNIGPRLDVAALNAAESHQSNHSSGWLVSGLKEEAGMSGLEPFHESIIANKEGTKVSPFKSSGLPLGERAFGYKPVCDGICVFRAGKFCEFTAEAVKNSPINQAAFEHKDPKFRNRDGHG